MSQCNNVTCHNLTLSHVRCSIVHCIGSGSDQTKRLVSCIRPCFKANYNYHFGWWSSTKKYTRCLNELILPRRKNFKTEIIHERLYEWSLCVIVVTALSSVHEIMLCPRGFLAFRKIQLISNEGGRPNILKFSFAWVSDLWLLTWHKLILIILFIVSKSSPLFA